MRDNNQCSQDKSNTKEALTPGEVVDVVHIHTISESLPKSYKMKVNGVPTRNGKDTGAAVSIVSEATLGGKAP